MTHHPLRDVGVNVYHCPEAIEAKRYIAFFTDANVCIYFPGPTHQNVYERAVAFQNRTVEANEATYVARIAALEAGRKKRKVKA